MAIPIPAQKAQQTPQASPQQAKQMVPVPAAPATQVRPQQPAPTAPVAPIRANVGAMSTAPIGPQATPTKQMAAMPTNAFVGLRHQQQAAQKPPSPLDDLNRVMEDSIKAIDEDTAKQQGMLKDQMLSSQRAADVINNRLGRSVGGGYAQLQGAAQGAGMDAIARAGLAGNEQKRNMLLAMYDKKLQQANRQEERDWQKEDMANAERQRIEQMIYEKTGEWPSKEAIDAAMGGKGTQKSGPKNTEEAMYQSAYDYYQSQFFNFGGRSSVIGKQVDSYIKNYYQNTGRWPSNNEVAGYLESIGQSTKNKKGKDSEWNKGGTYQDTTQEYKQDETGVYYIAPNGNKVYVNGFSGKK